MELTRRSFLAGIGSVTVGLLFARKLDAVLDSLERDLVAEQQAPEQQPSAADIVVMPQIAFRPERLVVARDIAPLFVFEDIWIGHERQFAGNDSVPADLFSADAFDPNVQFGVLAPGMLMRFRVRYVGKDPKGARFMASLIGRSVDSRGLLMLPIDSGVPIVG